MSFFEPRSWVERIAAQRQAEQMADERGREPVVFCACGGQMRRGNRHGKCFRCRKPEYDREQHYAEKARASVDNKPEARHCG